ncbi:MFS transporter [Phytohabitans sp. ZYX-F-186]|uniref:MFS transporter n=1 Tax=Phytohabitans maris TaxID=3071409 RepID=A0ABU0ZTQ6_9ACTN|nr:MFS transporter [Phytohabitans sp. ZYX-F-186]MDQ7909575.1 MFS transporter [Phytohabitans sp. ZYX-F-186]
MNRLRLALLIFAAFVISIDFNIVYVALPDIGHELGFTAQSLQWVVSAYAVGFGGLLLLGGRAVDRLGARRIFVLGLAVFGLASLAGGLAAEPGVLVAARVVQGTGGALLFPATLALINNTFTGPARGRALSLWGVAGSTGAVVGPMAGGVITNFLGWEWVFFVNAPLTLAAVVAALRVLPADRGGYAWGGFDLPGALVATAGSTLVVFGLVSGPEAGWGSARGAGALALGGAMLAAFVLIERRSRDPLAPPRLLGVRSLVTMMALIFVLMGTINTLHYLFYMDVQEVLGYSALGAGLAFLPMSVASIVGAAKLLPVLISRAGTRGALFTGVLGAGLSMAAVAAGMSAGGSYWRLLPGIVFLGLFAGMVYPMVFLASGADVAPGEQGVASALVSTSQQIGGAVGLAALVAVANAGLDVEAGAAPAAELVGGLRTAGWVAAAVAVAGAFLVLRLNGAEQREQAPATAEMSVGPLP